MPASYAIMFDVEDGGISNPVPWSKDNLKPNKIIMVIDEENSCIWLWYGKLRGLVSRRTAMRQAQSLRGHGYTVGKSVIGRNLEDILEIDERKIGRVPETTELNEKFMALLNMPFQDEGNCVVSLGSSNGGQIFSGSKANTSSTASAPESEPKPEPKPTPTPQPATPKPVEPKPEPTPDAAESEYNDSSVSVPSPTSASGESAKDLAKKGLLIIAIMDAFKDIWVSQKDDGSIAVEQMDGPVCHFYLENGNIKFKPGSFKDVDPVLKESIQNGFMDLVKNL